MPRCEGTPRSSAELPGESRPDRHPNVRATNETRRVTERLGGGASRAHRTARGGRATAISGGLCLTLVALAGCGGGSGGSNREPPHSGADSTQVNIGAMQLRHIHIEAPTAKVYRPGDDAGLFLTIFNNSSDSDALTAVTTPGAHRVVLRRGDQPPVAVTCVHIPGHANLSLQRGTDTHLELVGLQTKLFSAQHIDVTFTFHHAGSRTVQVPIQTTSHPTVTPWQGTQLAPCAAASPTG